MKTLLSRLRAQLRLETVICQSVSPASSALAGWNQCPSRALREPRASCHLLCKIKMISLRVCSVRQASLEVRNGYSQGLAEWLRHSRESWNELQASAHTGGSRGPKKPRKPWSAHSSDGMPGYNTGLPEKRTSTPSSGVWWTEVDILVYLLADMESWGNITQSMWASV